MRTVHRKIACCLAVACATAGALAIPLQDAAAQVSVGGVGYVHFQYALAKDTLAADSAIQHINNFDVTRAYVNVTGRFPGGISTRITTDIFTSGVVPGSRVIRLKYAFVAWTPDSSALTFKIGAMQTPWIDFEEALWDFRMQGPVAVDRNGYLSSSDFGAGVDGKWASDRFNFQAGVYNGENYNGALSDQRKDFMARASYRMLDTDDGTRVGGVRVSAYGQYGAPGTGGRRNRLIGMVSYRSNVIAAAAQYAMMQDSVHGGAATAGGPAIATAPLRHGRLISMFGTYHPRGTRFTVIGRVDLLDPQTDSTATAPGTSDQTTRLIAGVAYQLTPNVRLLGNADLLYYESGYTPTAANYAAYAARQSAYFNVMFTF